MVTFLAIVLGIVAALLLVAAITYPRWARNATGPSPPQPGFGLLALSGTESLVVGATIDFVLGIVIVSFVSFFTGADMPFVIKLLVALYVAVPLYLWGIHFGFNHVPLFELGVVTRLGTIIPSGPDGKGLRPGYYWFFLGWPFYTIGLTQTQKEISVNFDNMEVWTKNSATDGQGGIEGKTDGLAQFQVLDPVAYRTVEHPDEVLKAIVLESARDICESTTAEDFICTSNEKLAAWISDKILQKLAARTSPLGVRLTSVNVKRTDNRNEAVKNAWAEISAQRAQATARATDAAGRVRRIRAYRQAGVDPNRAVAADLVADDKAGATVGDQRFNLDVGNTLQGLGDRLAEILRR